MSHDNAHEIASAPSERPQTPTANVNVLGSRNLVFDSGLMPIDDPGIVTLHIGYDDLVKLFEHPAPII